MHIFLHYVSGFLTALILVSAILIIVYNHLKRKHLKKNKIIGYLDLIPDLTQQQRKQAQSIRKVFLPKVAGIRKCLHIQRSKLAEALFMEPCNELEIQSISKKIIRLQTELEHEVVEHILEEKELLSPSQKRNFYTIIVDQFSAGGLGIHDIKGK
ncbi:Spy/CpxP family protein refolding chaperone [Desulfobacula toluolica]|uniref:Uncharacterized protein n=1 Tax=Desulfobacula toluolica (strain DSM 7467 / Tol2) TaxID=651182 RepID=K0NFU6_DESTT|nr:periplasmic heavy metal sensor [Desulfobacula toluolica]CCK79820.1 uncharacterized protein TOL2_C16580 [Desulfobacula toluolica Tol2]